MKRSKWWAWALAANAAAVVVVAACVGEDPPAGLTRDPNAKPGEFRGPCDQGRCFPGLRCDSELELCVRENDASDGDGGTSSSGGSSGASSSGGSSGASSGSVDGSSDAGCSFNLGSTNERFCLADGGPCSLAVCCIREDSSECEQSEIACQGTATGRAIACTGRDTCPSTDACCATLTNAAPMAGQCNAVSLGQFLKTKCEPTTCASTHYRVCRNDGECDGGKCTQLSITATVGTVVLGTCL